MLRTFSLVCLLLACLTASCFANLPRWDTGTQGKFVSSLTQDAAGRVWVGTEERGVYTASGTQPELGWTHYDAKDGLGDDSVTALACDLKGRVWVGLRRSGVSVYNGQAWKSYDAVHGPLGSHVFALAVSPKDGDVWIATDAGLTRYSQTKDAWLYYTRTNGLPSDQIQALAFDAKGTLYVGTQADGIAIGSVADDYAAWRTVGGPAYPSPFPSGSGLSDRRITALVAARDGSIYAGTPSGLVGSQDSGKTWHYLRGSDWLAKAQGRAGTRPNDLQPASVPTLAEDYVSALAEDSAGRLWVGHKSRGVEAADTANPGHALVNIFVQPDTDDVHFLLPAGPSVLVGGYGSGLAVAPSTDPDAPAWAARPAPPQASLPTPAAAPSVADLKVLLALVPTTAPLKPGAAVYLGDDWQTQGDWVGRYGRQYAELCGLLSPESSEEVSEDGYSASDDIGPHNKDEGTYTYIGQATTPEIRFPYAPSLRHRRDSEVNDGSWQGDKYSQTFDGPDLWITFSVPAGAHRASFYFVNNDGHGGIERFRNYILELKADGLTRKAEDRAPSLASAQVNDFYTGVYKRFLVMGPGTFHLKIGRSYSSCTKLQGIFLDRISDVPAVLPPIAGPASLGLTAVAEANPNHAAQAKTVVRVVSVTPGSPADRAGIRPNDLILSAGQDPVTSPERPNEIYTELIPESVLSLALKRGDETLTVDVEAAAAIHSLPSAFTTYAPPAVSVPAANEPDALTAARALWSALNVGTAQTGGAAMQTRGRILAYRAALAANAPAALLANWRWHLLLWSDADRADFAQAMSKAAKAPPSPQ